MFVELMNNLNHLCIVFASQGSGLKRQQQELKGRKQTRLWDKAPIIAILPEILFPENLRAVN